MDKSLWLTFGPSCTPGTGPYTEHSLHRCCDGSSSPSVGPVSSTRPVGADARPPLPSSDLVGLQWYTDQRLQMSAGCPLMTPTPSYGRPLDPTRPVFSHAPYFAAAISPRNVSPPYPESCPGPDPLDPPGAHCAVY